MSVGITGTELETVHDSGKWGQSCKLLRDQKGPDFLDVFINM